MTAAPSSSAPPTVSLRRIWASRLSSDHDPWENNDEGSVGMLAPSADQSSRHTIRRPRGPDESRPPYRQADRQADRLSDRLSDRVPVHHRPGYRGGMPADPAAETLVTEALVPLAPPAAARGAVRDMVGYRMAPMPGRHRGFPSPYLTLVFSLSGALPIEIPF